MERDQLAAAINQTASGGSFNNKIAAARMFGLIDTDQGRFQLTPLGFDILEPSRERAAKVSAFLNVPLFKKVFDTYRGRQLPPKPSGLEHAFVSFGVSTKQRETARRVFERSARASGFFPSDAEDRLVQPVLGVPAPTVAPSEPAEPVAEGNAPQSQGRRSPTVAYDLGRPRRHPFIEGLLETLPEDKAEWPSADRVKWLQAAAQIFDLLYAGGNAEISVTVRKAGE